MECLARFTVKHRILIILFFLAAAMGCLPLSMLAEGKGGFDTYRPKDAETVKAEAVMDGEFGRGIPNARVMVRNVSVAGALDYKSRLQNAEGVEEVFWLDDVVNIQQPLEMADPEAVESWYREKDACYILVLDEDRAKEAVESIDAIIGEEGCLEGEVPQEVYALRGIKERMPALLLLMTAGLLVFILLFSDSWLEPVPVLLTAAVAVLFSRGTDLLFESVSVSVRVVGTSLQAALLTAFAVMFIHRLFAISREGIGWESAPGQALKETRGCLLTGSLLEAAVFAAFLRMKSGWGIQLGLWMIRSVLFNLICLLVFLPALVSVLLPLLKKTEHAFRPAAFRRLNGAVQKLRIPALILLLLLLPMACLAQNRLSFSYGAESVPGAEKDSLMRERFGDLTTVTLLVPKGDADKETAMQGELEKLPAVKTVLSLVNILGNMTPEEVLREKSEREAYTRFCSEHYSLFILSLDSGEGKESRESTVTQICCVGEKYYGDSFLYNGELARIKEQKDLAGTDRRMLAVFLAAVLFLLLLVIFRSLLLPVLILGMTAALVVINLSVSYFLDQTLPFFAVPAAGAAQVFLTVDCSAVLCGSYMRNRKGMQAVAAAREMLRKGSFRALLPALLTVSALLVLSGVSPDALSACTGMLAARGSLISVLLIPFVLSALLTVMDPLIAKTTLHADFLRKGQGRAKD